MKQTFFRKDVRFKGSGSFNMAQQMSLWELKKYYERSKPKQITYYTEDQDWYWVLDPCKLRLHFDTITVLCDTNMVCLKSGKSTMFFDRVRFAEIETEVPAIGVVLTIYCGYGADGEVITHRLITK